MRNINSLRLNLPVGLGILTANFAKFRNLFRKISKLFIFRFILIYYNLLFKLVGNGDNLVPNY